MAIRLRRVDGITVALCAARSVEQKGDIYLDDNLHQALTQKFAIDFNSAWGLTLPVDADYAKRIAKAESNNANRTWWDETYGADNDLNKYLDAFLDD